ncbi:MAG: SDR family oxidoreductase [Acidobacteriota bacterium]
MRLLLSGVTGYIGSRLLTRLTSRGHEVVCLVRDLARVPAQTSPAVRFVQGDVLQSDGLQEAMKGVQAAYYLIHSMNAGAEFEKRDRLAARNFAEAARQAGVERVMYLGGLGAPESRLSRHLKSRQETGDLLREFGPPVTEFRAAIIVGSGSVSFEMIRYLTERIPIMICPSWVKTRCQPIAIRDVLSYLVAALEQPESIGQVIDIGGATIETYGSMMLTYAELRGLRRYLLHVPFLTPKLSSYWVDLVTPIPASICRPLIQGLKNEVICLNDRARELFPSIHPMEYREAVRLALQRLSAGTLESVWSGSFSSTEDRTPPQVRLLTTEGMVIEVRESIVEASGQTLFQVFSQVGGERGWFYGDWLWRVRAGLDRLLGGVGMRRGRRDPRVLRPGDPVDFWRVEAVEPDRLIRLRAEMKLPGRAWLQFESLSGQDRPTRFRSTAYFEPRGLAGHLYWWALYPLHMLIFAGLNRNIAWAAERQHAASSS